MSICANICGNGGAGKTSAPKPAWLESFEAARDRDLSSASPLSIEEELLEEELILEQIAEYLSADAARPEVLTAIGRGLKFIKVFWAKASFAKEAEVILEVLYLLGASRSPEMRMKSAILNCVIGREGRPLAEIAREFGISRAAVSKTAREMKRFLNLEVHTATRVANYTQECSDRARRVHEKTRNDRAKAADQRLRNNGAGS